MAEVNVQGLGKAFGATRALTDVSFRLRGGEVLALLGENGAGKSTLIKILCGVHEADQGQISISGLSPRHSHSSSTSVLDLKAYRRSIAFIAQDPALFRGTLRDNLDVEFLLMETSYAFGRQKMTFLLN